MGYYVEEDVKDVKEQFALYYPAAMEWIADNVKHIESYIVTFPHETDDGKGGYYCNFSIDMCIYNGSRLTLNCSYTFSTNCEEGMYYREPTLKKFDSWSYGGRLTDPYIKIGNGNVNLYIEKLNEELAKIVG
nr:MAG TPA: hypothetical protein [Caudoviricetes sp.]